ncbi:hypothetical protein OL548_26835 [Lysinibacillus sp. MHQ-1]|nr:hypothetical protein OL548_26835 [Lysinibacillus sp. MHQ-1]
MNLYKGMKIDKPDQYLIETGGFLVESNVLLVNEHFELCGILNIVKDDEKSKLLFPSGRSSARNTRDKE